MLFVVVIVLIVDVVVGCVIVILLFGFFEELLEFVDMDVDLEFDVGFVVVE